MQVATKIWTSSVTDTGSAIIRALAYSSVFSYPLRKEEILEKLPFRNLDQSDVDAELSRLRDLNIVVFKDEHYYLSELTGALASRKDRNERAKKYLGTARMVSRFIGNFPFVRGVFLSGSISKDCMNKDSDIDYFIITAPGRLWICRTLLIAFKKIFLFNSYKFFCLNYFLDSDHLEISDRNIYTATEIKTLIPTYGKKYCDQFMEANRWTNDFLPNYNDRSLTSVPAYRKRGLKWLVEKVLSPAYGNHLNNYFKSLSLKYWKRKYEHLPEWHRREINDSSDTKSAHHPENFKQKVLNRYHAILRETEFKHDLRFS